MNYIKKNFTIIALLLDIVGIDSCLFKGMFDVLSHLTTYTLVTVWWVGHTQLVDMGLVLTVLSCFCYGGDPGPNSSISETGSNKKASVFKD